jgi:membrane protease YdiL (CAAX protease family)
MPAPQTERYLDLARLGRNEWWAYLLGMAAIVLFLVVFGSAPYRLLTGAGLEPGPMLEFIAVNLSIFTLFAGLVVAVKVVHGRPLMSLVAPDLRLDWARIGRAAWVWLALSAATAGIEHLLYPDRYYLSYDAARFYPFVAAVLLLTPLQAAVEELVFRGYLMQGLGLLTRRPLLIAAASSVLFTLPHLMNPEVYRYGLLIMAANYFAIGMLFAIVTLRDGRLELAIGLHAVNNVFLALAANYEGSALATESVFTATELDPYYSLAAITLAAFAFCWWIFRRALAEPPGATT